MLEFEQEVWAAGFKRIAGVDEAGRGPLAGPVVAAALCFKKTFLNKPLPDELLGLRDSKKVSVKNRDAYFDYLIQSKQVDYGIGILEADEIDRVNILKATHQAMVKAVAAMKRAPDYILVDGLAVASLPEPNQNIIKGDDRSLSIAAASIIAKVTRDRIMEEWDRSYPEYGFARHKGYGTKRHMEAIREKGPCPCHRRSFRPVSQLELF